MNIGFHPLPASLSSLRNLCALSVGVYPGPVGALSFSFPPHLLALFTLLALSLEGSLEGRPEGRNEGTVVEGSSACPVYPACPACPEPRSEPRREERREHSRRVNLLSFRLLPAVDCKLSAVSCRPFFANCHRIIFSAYPHPLTSIESYSCKKQGGGVPLTPNPGRRASCLCEIRRNPPNFNLFMGLLHNSRTPPGGGSFSRFVQTCAGQSQLTPLDSAVTKKGEVPRISTPSRRLLSGSMIPC